MIYVFDREERLQAILDNDDKNSCPIYDPNETEVLNGEHVFSFRVPLFHEDTERIIERGYIAFKDEDDKFKLFLITEIEEFHGTHGEKIINCESASLELIDDIIESAFIDRKTPAQAVGAVLTGTRWELGDSEGVNEHTYTITHKTALEALQTVVERWGLEVRFRIDIIGNKIARRFVDVYTTRGDELGKRIEYAKDMEEIRRTIDARNIKTALFGIGAEITNETTGEKTRVTFTELHGKSYVEDTTAREKWGRFNVDETSKRHLFGFYESTTDDPQTLLDETTEALNQMNKPVVTYEVKAIDLERLTNAPHERTRLGDTVYIIDRDLGLELKARVIERRPNKLDPLKNEYVLGNFTPFFTDEINKQENELRQAIGEKIGEDQITNVVREGDTIYTHWLEREIALTNQQIIAGGGTVHISDTEGVLVTDQPTIEASTRAIRLNAGELALANEKNADGTFNYRTFGTGEGFLADLVNTGFIRFDRARGGTLQLGGELIGEDADGNPIYQNGIMELINQAGEEVATLSGDYGGFTTLRIDVLKNTQNIVMKTFDQFYEDNLINGEIIFYVDPTDGDDANIGTIDFPKQTVQPIIDALPKFIDHVIRIRYVTSQLRESELSIIGFYGTGEIILEKWNNTIRYIRDWTNGSTSNSSNHWIEIGLRTDTGYYAHANGDTANILTNTVGTVKNLGMASDGVISSSSFADLWSETGSPVYIDVYTRGGYDNAKWIEVYHHWANDRTYFKTKTEVSADRVKWFTVFDSARGGEYAETTSGRKHTVKHATINGVVKVEKNAIPIRIKNLMVNAQATVAFPIRLEFNQFVELNNVVSFGRITDVAYNCYTVGGHTQISDSEFNGASTALIASRAGATVEAINNIGGDSPYVFNARGAIIVGAGTSPKGSTALNINTGGGQTFGSFTETIGEWTAVRIVEKTSTWSNKSSRSYDDGNGGWRTDHTDVLQGKYSSYGLYRGLWFFGEDIRNAVNGKTIKKIRVYVTRASSSGNVTGSTLEIRAHSYANQPTGQPAFMGTAKQVKIDRGQSLWVDVTAEMKDNFSTGLARGVGIYTTSTASDRYIRMTGSAKVEITYEDTE